VLAVGGDLKGAVCLAAGTDAWLGQHVGDLGSLAGAQALEASARHLVALLRVRPEVVACDAHPGYVSGRLAARLAAEWDVPLVRVQHHHAHVASALAEAQVDAAAVGVAYDGTGYGPTARPGAVSCSSSTRGRARRPGSGTSHRSCCPAVTPRCADRPARRSRTWPRPGCPGARTSRRWRRAPRSSWGSWRGCRRGPAPGRSRAASAGSTTRSPRCAASGRT
jgi:hypothetical protein